MNEAVAEIVGKDDVYFYDCSQGTPDDGPDYVRVAAGGRYDLANRAVIDVPPR